MRLRVLSSWSWVGALADSREKASMSNDSKNMIATDKLALDFSRDWKLAQSDLIKEAMSYPLGSVQRTTKAMVAAGMGQLVDTYIVMWDMDPWLAHIMRTNSGIPWVGNFEGLGIRYGFDPDKPLNIPQPWPTPPPGTIPTVPFDAEDYDGTMSRLHKLYPLPAPPPLPVVPSQRTGLIGTYMGGGLYKGGPQATRETIVNGKEYEENGKRYRAFVPGSELMDTSNSTWSCFFWLL